MHRYLDGEGGMMHGGWLVGFRCMDCIFGSVVHEKRKQTSMIRVCLLSSIRASEQSKASKTTRLASGMVMEFEQHFNRQLGKSKSLEVEPSVAYFDMIWRGRP